jgi:RNA polymerase sigma factor (sigma-70 family)
MQPERSENAALLDDALSAFVSVRPRLFGIAYRILTSAAAAEDIVQDVWLRWQTTDRSMILDAPAFLVTMTTRLAINLAQSARSRHETYIRTWFPEPVGTSNDPHLGAERGEALEFAVLLLLEKLSPTERAAYVLREAFDYSYRGIADVLKLTEANIRQLVSRARKHISDRRRATVSAAEQRRLLVAFIDAAHKGDTAALEELFVADMSPSEAEQAHSCFTSVATPPGTKGPYHSRLISPYLSHCSAVSQIGRLSGHSEYVGPKKKLGTVNLGNTSRYIDKSLTECLPFPCGVNGARHRFLS